MEATRQEEREREKREQALEMWLSNGILWETPSQLRTSHIHLIHL